MSDTLMLRKFSIGSQGHPSNKQGFLNKQEKAFKQLSLIVIGFTICFLPYFIVFLIVALCEDCVSERFQSFTVWLGYFNSTINPFLYAFTNRSTSRLNSSTKPPTKQNVI
jgi:hypothetical protein